MSVNDFEQQHDVKFVDGFDLGNTAIASDPCYELGVWCQLEIQNVSAGRYDAFVRILQGHVAELIAVKQDGRYEYPTYPYGDPIGVDSGQAGIFDRDWWERNAGPHGYLDCYDDICQVTLGYLFGTYDDSCVVSSSGWGDGGYQVYVDDMDDIQAIGIIFIED